MTFNFKKTLVVIVLLGFIVRIYKVTTPLADWHSFRQSDTASVTREYVKHGIDLLRPKYQDLSNIQSGIRVNGADNTEGWRMVEFPIINALIAVALRLFPSFDLVITSRLFSIFASLVSIAGLGIIGKKLFSDRVGLFSALFFALNPYTVYYSRVVLPEPFLVMSIIVSLVFFVNYEVENREQRKENRKRYLYLLASALFFCFALLLKPMAVFYAPMFIAVAYVVNGWRGIFDPAVTLLFSASVVPFFMWRKWIENFPAGIPASDWLFNGNGIRLRPAWFRWLFWERSTKLILGYSGVLLVVSTIISFFGWKKEHWILVSGGLGLLAYLIVFATGNVQHDYYQVLLTPYIALVVGYGMNAVLKYQIPNTKYQKMGVFSLFALSIFLSWQQVKGYYNINNWAIVHAGQVTDKLLPEDAKVIAPYQGDTAFLFQTNRTGWPIGFDIDKKIAEGAGYYVSVNYDDEARELEKKYTTITKTPEYIILDLTKGVASSK